MCRFHCSITMHSKARNWGFRELICIHMRCNNKPLSQASVTHEGAQKEENGEEYKAETLAQQGKKEFKEILDRRVN